MSSPRPKVNPPLCGICMSSVDVRQEPDGGWHCRKQRCFRQRTYKPIMVTEIEKDEPVRPGLMNRLLTFLMRDIDEDRRPKHPRPEFPSRCLRSPKNTGAPRPKPPQPAPLNPPQGSGACPPPPPPIHVNVVGLVGNEAEELLKEDYGATMRAYREERRRSGGVPMYPQDSDAEEKDHDQLPAEKGWSKRETEPASETPSTWWTAIKWSIGVGASISLGWILEWAFF